MSEEELLYHQRRESIASTIGTNFSGLKIENGLGIPDWELPDGNSLQYHIMAHVGNMQRQMVPLGINRLTIYARPFKEAENYHPSSTSHLDNGSMVGRAVNTQATVIAKSQLKLGQPEKDSCWRPAIIILNSDYIQKSVESRGMKNPENWISPLNKLLKYELTNLAGEVLRANWERLTFDDKYKLITPLITGLMTIATIPALGLTLAPLFIGNVMILGKAGADKSIELTKKYGLGPSKSQNGYYGNKLNVFDKGLHLVDQVKARYRNARNDYFSVRDNKTPKAK